MPTTLSEATQTKRLLKQRNAYRVELPIVSNAGTDTISFALLADKVYIYSYVIKTNGDVAEITDIPGFSVSPVDANDQLFTGGSTVSDNIGEICKYYNLEFGMTGVGTTVSVDSGEITHFYALYTTVQPLTS